MPCFFANDVDIVVSRQEFRPPNAVQQNKMMELLSLYLKNLEDVKAELSEILKRIAVDNTVIVMVCNFGQSELLVNFVCAAHARGFDISNVIVFTTDQETDDLARGLGLTTYYDHRVRTRQTGEIGAYIVIVLLVFRIPHLYCLNTEFRPRAQGSSGSIWRFSVCLQYCHCFDLYARARIGFSKFLLPTLGLPQ